MPFLWEGEIGSLYGFCWSPVTDTILKTQGLNTQVKEWEKWQLIFLFLLKKSRWVGGLESNYLCDEMLVFCSTGPCSSGYFGLLNQTH